MSYYHTSKPETLAELRRLPFAQRATMWEKYTGYTFHRQNTALWYYIQCERKKLKIAAKHIKKIQTYINNPDKCLTQIPKNRYNLHPGKTMTKEFHGTIHTVLVADGYFLYHDKIYKTLSAVARAIAGFKVSGPDFFGLVKRKSQCKKLNAQSIPENPQNMD